MNKKILFFIILGLFQHLEAQNIDSLWHVFKHKNQEDTVRLNALNTISWSYVESNPDSAITLAKQLMQFAKKKGDKKYEAKAFHTIGYASLIKGNYKVAIENLFYSIEINKAMASRTALQRNYRHLADAYYYDHEYNKSIEYYNKALAISKELNDRVSECYFYHNIAEVYIEYPNYPMALMYYLTALKIGEEIKSDWDIEKCNRGIGDIYCAQNNFDKSLEYYFKALKINENHKSEDGIANCYIQIASNYYFKKMYVKAEEYYIKALQIDEKINYQGGIANCYVGLANVYSDQLISDKALDYYLRALKIKEKGEPGEGLLICYINTGGMYLVLNDYKTALEYQKKGLVLAEKIQNFYYISYAHEGLAKAYAKSGNYKEAYLNYVKFKQFTDTIFNKENSKQLSDLKVNFEVEKKENELTIKAEAEQDKLKALAREEKKIQYLIIFSVTGILVLVVVFSIFLYKRFTITKRQKRIIEIKSKETEIQKHLVEEKQKEIIDSITYAKRLQQAILPPQDFINSYLPDNFFLYKPKDIIAGDFYWMHVSDGSKEKSESIGTVLPTAPCRLFIAAADSTVHGVPGAMVSIVCSNALEKAVKEFGLIDTGKILDKATDLVLETFARSGEEIKDGMDISLLCIDKEQRKVFWSGAHNHLLYISNNELKEIKADKQPIGKSDHRKPFTTHEIPYAEGTVFYLMTDGYPDQFGGPKGKKFKYKQLESLILENYDKPLDQQLDILNAMFIDWKGGLEQVDDVTIIGIKI